MTKKEKCNNKTPLYESFIESLKLLLVGQTGKVPEGIHPSVVSRECNSLRKNTGIFIRHILVDGEMYITRYK